MSMHYIPFRKQVGAENFAIVEFAQGQRIVRRHMIDGKPVTKQAFAQRLADAEKGEMTDLDKLRQETPGAEGFDPADDDLAKGNEVMTTQYTPCPWYEVINLDTDEGHGVYRSLDEARGCVQFDRLTAYQIWSGKMEQGEFIGMVRVENCEPCRSDDPRVLEAHGTFWQHDECLPDPYLP